jgi:hypothetical protein
MRDEGTRWSRRCLPPALEIVPLFSPGFAAFSDPEGVLFHSPGLRPGARESRRFAAEAAFGLIGEFTRLSRRRDDL